MRILVGVNAQQQGHFARAAQLIPRLRERGHTVRTLSSGQPLPRFPDWASEDHAHFDGLPYVERDGRTDLAATAATWTRTLPRLLAIRRRVERLIGLWRPDLIISDFEIHTGGPGLRADCPVVSACRQNAVLDPSIPLPEGGRGRQITRTVIRLFTMGADRRLAYHFAPASPRCLPPMLRAELIELSGPPPAMPDGPLLVYNSQHFGDGGDLNSLRRFAASTGREIVAYGYPGEPRRTFAEGNGRVTLRPASRTGLLEDMRAASAVATTAGFALPLEAALLGKPTLAVPLPGQWEQTVNAAQLESLGLAHASDRWDLTGLSERPAPTIPIDLRRWLTQPVDAIVDAILAIAR